MAGTEDVVGGTPLGEENDFLSVGEDDVVHVRLDVLKANLAVLAQRGHINLNTKRGGGETLVGWSEAKVDRSISSKESPLWCTSESQWP